MSNFNERVEDLFGGEVSIESADNDMCVFLNSCTNAALDEDRIDYLIDMLTRAKKHIQENRTNC